MAEQDDARRSVTTTTSIGNGRPASGVIASDLGNPPVGHHRVAGRHGAGVSNSFVLSYLLGFTLIAALVHFAGFWNIVANTRALAALIAAGIVPLGEDDPGIGGGVPAVNYWIRSQDPVDWGLLVLAVALFLTVAALKGLQFHRIADFVGINGTFGQHARAFFFGYGLNRMLPFRAGEVAWASALEGQGASLPQATKAVTLLKGFVVFEIVVFAIIGLFASGVLPWVIRLAYPLAILTGAWLLMRGLTPRAQRRARGHRPMRAALESLVREPRVLVELAALSLVAFMLIELASYVVPQAFASVNVPLIRDEQRFVVVSGGLIIMAVVGGYIARMVQLTPGGVGQFEWGFALVLTTGGLSFADAATIALLVSAVRYVTGGILFGATMLTRGVETSLGRVLALYTRPAPGADAALGGDAVPQVAPDGDGRADARAFQPPRAPSARRLWTRVLLIATIVLGVFLFDALTVVLVDLWLLQSLGLESVFWTNFRMGSLLFVAGFVFFAAAVAGPAITHRLAKPVLKRVLWLAALVGLFAGYSLADRYHDVLGPTRVVDFGRVDPVFGRDVSFYIFELPAIQLAVDVGLLLGLGLLLSSLVTSWMSNRAKLPRHDGPRIASAAMRVATPVTMGAIAFLGALMAFNVWLRRYDLLLAENWREATETGIGADYLDVTGFFSTEHSIYVEAAAVLMLAVGLVLTLVKARRARLRPGSVDLRRAFALPAILLVLLPGITLDASFRTAVAARDALAVTPNEPVVQLPYLQRHIKATNAAFGMDRIETRDFRPRGPGDPKPDFETLANTATVRNAPLWPGFVSRYSRRVAPQYVPRILAAEGDMTIYAPLLETLRAQEKLRPYYDFLDVDTTVHEVDGDRRMFATAVRELPQDLPEPWLQAWGQRSFLFTHGYGLVAAPAGDRTNNGDPTYAVRGIPAEANAPSLDAGEQRVYYGEGAARVGYSNAAGIKEHDRPTDQDRAEVEFPEELPTGIKFDSFLKRVVLAWHTREVPDVLFSDMIDADTRAHLYRRPIERIERIAPYLAVDTDPYAVPADGRLTWMVNALTHADEYPYSARILMGDGADLRTEMRPLEEVNYIADSVKVTIDANTGDVRMFKIADEPIVDTWAAVYPDLFEPASAMPEDVRAQMQYPPALMSAQFNKIYPFYHQTDPLTFFSQEDILDDADEVVGPIRGEGTGIRFSQGLYNWMADARPGGDMPAAEDGPQFALTKNYTPQDALNLRGIATAYQSGEDYGRLSVLQVPKGRFFPGPEQADAALDQDSYIAQQIGLWNRQGVEVIRGHTSLLVAEGEAIYVEPIFIRSRQNPIPQLQRVVVVFRGEAHMGRTMREALRFAIEGGRLQRLDEPAGAPTLPIRDNGITP